jgi:FkbM family methyltransferase
MTPFCNSEKIVCAPTREGALLDSVARRYIWRAGRKLYMWARKDEPNEMASNGEFRLQRLLVDGSKPASPFVAFDVGARIGDWSKSLLEYASGRAGEIKIHAFEPSPDSRNAILKAHRNRIASGDLRINPEALSDEAQKLPFYVPHLMAGTSTLHRDSNAKYQQVMEIETMTADEYCRINSIEHINLFKIDTEGNDLKVIRGALGLLKASRIDVLQFEYNHRWIYSRSFLKDVFDLIQHAPYHVAKVCSDGLEAYTEWHPELEKYFETNYALIHEKFLASLDCRLFRIGHGNACERVRRATSYPPARPQQSR